MIVITLTDCPASLRGDLTKWLQEINTGVFVGNVSARVRDELWKRIRDNVKSGRATMVFSTDNEQRMDFRVLNGGWEPIDFDGLKLMLRPSPSRMHAPDGTRFGKSNASAYHKVHQMASKRRHVGVQMDTYAIVDIETTGLSAQQHEIIEIGALIVHEGKETDRFHAFVKPTSGIPPAIQALTGITMDVINRRGRALSQVMPELLSFLGDLTIVSHNAIFDLDFMRTACTRCGLPPLSNPCIDTLTLSRRLIDETENHKLATLAVHFAIPMPDAHNSISDCLTLKLLFDKLNELTHAAE